MQTVLGANGVIGRELSRHLPEYSDRIRQVSRSPKRVNATDELFSADLLDAQATADAVAGSTVTYLVAGLKYDHTVWEEQWPKVMRNAMDACKRHRSALVFFDNVYAYGRVDGVMTEDTPYNPRSRKGDVRARIATMLMDEAKRGELSAMIVRAADFYGPDASLSVTHATVTERLKANKAPQWLGTRKPCTHSRTRPTRDAVSPCWGTWHRPTVRCGTRSRARRRSRVNSTCASPANYREGLTPCRSSHGGCCSSWASSSRWCARTWRCSTSSSTTIALTAARPNGLWVSRLPDTVKALPRL